MARLYKAFVYVCKADKTGPSAIVFGQKTGDRTNHPGVFLSPVFLSTDNPIARFSVMVFPRFCRHAWAKPGDSFSRTTFPSSLALTIAPSPSPLRPRSSTFSLSEDRLQPRRPLH
jgi:hypothetical protein